MRASRGAVSTRMANILLEDLRQGKIITFHGDKPFIITSKSTQNPDSSDISPSREEVVDALQSLLDGQISRLSEEADYATIIALSESIRDLAKELQDPSRYY